MKKILLLLICLSLMGCAIIPGRKAKIQTRELNESVLKKDEEIKTLQNLLKEKDRLLKEKDVKIEELRKKLEGFGAFEK